MERKRSVGIAVGLLAALVGVGLWWRRHPSACPYGLRLSLDPEDGNAFANYRRFFSDRFFSRAGINAPPRRL